MSQTKEQRLSLEAMAARDRWAGSPSPSDTESWECAVAPIVERVEVAEEARDTLAAEVKRLKETAEHLGANLKTARAEVLRLEGDWRALSVMVTDQRREADQQRTRADRMAAGIDALVERYSELQRGAR